MKNYLLLLLSLSLVIFGCSHADDPIPVVEDAKITVNDAKVELSNRGGVKSIGFDTNKNWTAKSDAAWCVLSATSGDALVKSITVTVAANDTYDDRGCVVTISAGGLSKSVTVAQGEGFGLLVTQDKYELTNEAATIEVEVKANIDYDVAISDGWIARVDTRGLATTKLNFEIAENTAYDNREGTITIKQKEGNLSSIIKVLQYQKNAIIIGEKNIEGVSYERGTIEVGVLTNTDLSFEFMDGSGDWLSVVETRALENKTVVVLLQTNGEYDRRGAIRFVGAGGVADTLTIVQDGVKPILMDFYNATGGDNWYNNDNWGSSLPVEEWFGVSVSDGIVIWLAWVGNNLSGTIPPSISKLRSIAKIMIYGNNLLDDIGVVIDRVSDLKKLMVLSLTGNRLYGEIPSSIGKLEALVIVELANNNISGEIPAEFANLKQLEVLKLNNNYLTGTIPDGIGASDNFVELQTNFNNLEGPLPLSLLTTPNWINIMDWVINQRAETIIPPKEYARVRNMESRKFNMEPIKTYDVFEKNEYTILYFYDYRCGFCHSYTGVLVDLLDRYKDKGLGAISYHMCMLPDLEDLDLIVEYTENMKMDNFVNLLDLYDGVTGRDSYFIGSRGTPAVMLVDRDGALVYGSSDDRNRLPQFIEGLLGDEPTK